jgi:O-antigen/teichoic acid export membrane protein
MVARVLGPTNFGSYSFALAFSGVFTTLSLIGNNNIIVRDITHNPSKKDEIIGSAIALRVIAGSIFFICSIIANSIFSPKYVDPNLKNTIFIISTIIFFQVVDVFESWFQAKIMVKKVILAKDAALVLGIILKILLIYTKTQNISMYAVVYLIEYILTAIFITCAYYFSNDRRIGLSINLELLKKYFYKSIPIIFSVLAIYIQSKIDPVILSKWLFPKDIGMYSIAINLVDSLAFIPMAIYTTAAPIISGAKIYLSPKDYQLRLKYIFTMLLIVSGIISIFIFAFSKSIIFTLYGIEYASAATLLKQMAFRIIFISYGIGRGLYIVNEDLFTYAMINTVCMGLFGFLLNIYAIPLYGIVTPIYVYYLTSIIFLVLFDLFYKHTKTHANNALQLLLDPFKTIKSMYAFVAHGIFIH